eukprot:NODE_3035_length_462_cov_102.988060_g2985_i0.p2 GENE.NODE_3035_length_462_cov_102.988060_g2985_i0~~NODE_3035_length_462_cov_102.988060_g2985_i0.p2  ORF type:complete len:104 (-),score=18.29 NODE_3035_length_462_cov_102.988060_g2985_i0:49-360(-)
MPVVAKSGIAVGANAGHVTTPHKPRAKRSRVKGVRSKRVKQIRDVIREVVGFAPYERRVMELLKVGKDKRARKFTKKRLGTMVRAKRKVEELNQILVAQRRGQ